MSWRWRWSRTANKITRGLHCAALHPSWAARSALDPELEGASKVNRRGPPARGVGQ